MHLDKTDPVMVKLKRLMDDLDEVIRTILTDMPEDAVQIVALNEASSDMLFAYGTLTDDDDDDMITLGTQLADTLYAPGVLNIPDVKINRQRREENGT